MEIVFFTKYSRKGASSRLRSYQYFDSFEDEGFKITTLPLFTDEYLDSIYNARGVGIFSVLKYYFLRLSALFKVKKYDLVVIEKELFPYCPSWGEWLLKVLGVKVIVDYDDAIFHAYDISSNYLIRTLFSKKIMKVMRYANLVVAGNDYIANYAKSAGAKQVVIIPTVINVANYKVKEHVKSLPVIIGWIGSPTTVKYLKQLYPVLKYICENYSVKVYIIGGMKGIGLNGCEKVIEWSEDKEAELIRECDIGVMPLEDSAWAKGKCGYKLIQYMGSGLPVIGSPVGVNEIIIQNGVNGFKASDAKSWQAALETLIKDFDLREKMGVEGRKMVEERFSSESMSKIWIQKIREIHNAG